MRKLFFVGVVISFFAAPVELLAQQKASGCSCGFQSLLQGGLLEGDAGPSWNFQTVNGMYYKGWFAGVGVGLDHYLMRTIPLFIDFRKDILKGRKTPFVYADGGLNFDWLRTREKPGWGDSHYEKGRYYDVGAGYKLTFKSFDALFISAGYTMKRLNEERVIAMNDCVQPPCNPSSEYFKYKFSRLTFKVGWQFR